MIREVLMAGLATLTLNGCFSMQDLFLRDNLQKQEKIVNYFKDGRGYSIDTPFEKIRFVYRIDNKGKKTCTLLTKKENLFNQGCDETVDLAGVKERAELSTKEQEFYDELFSVYKDGLRVKRTHEKWKLLR